MLILIAGCTGNVGQKCIAAALSRHHQVRGLGRTPSKLPSELFKSLESFVTLTSSYDVGALNTAVTGVDPVICAYSGMPQLALEGQLFLLRACERAGIKRYI